MSNELLVAVLALVGTLAGSLGGILIANKLVNYRLEQLEKKVEKHNNACARIALIEKDIRVANHRIEDLEEAVS